MSGDPDGLAAEVNDALFETWGRDAVYVDEVSGITLDCVILKDARDREINTRTGISRPIMQGNVFRLRASEVPQPVKEAIITITASGDRFKIIEQPKTDDDEHSVFRFTVEQIRP